MNSSEDIVSKNRQIGSILFVVGIEVGAGILALPILIAHIGFPLGCLVMLIAWLLMTYTALLICEANLSCENGVSFGGMAQNILGGIAQFVVWASFMALLYIIMVAYISASQSSFSQILHLDTHVISLLFVALFGLFVMMGTAVVDIVNRVLLGVKLFLLLFVCCILLPNVHVNQLLISFINSKEIFMALPVFITSFTSHLIIPSLRTYLNSNAKVMTRVILIGSSIPLLLYLVWIVGILGVIPHDGINSFTSLFASKKTDANVGDVLNLIRLNLNNSLFYAPVLLFSNISVTTSFLAVSLALYHFLVDGFKLNKLTLLTKNTIATILTFVMPLLIVWFFPNIFLKALGYVGLCCSVLLVIIPVLMIRKLKNRGHQFKIVGTSNPILLNLALILGVLVVIIKLIF